MLGKLKRFLEENLMEGEDDLMVRGVNDKQKTRIARAIKGNTLGYRIYAITTLPGVYMNKGKAEKRYNITIKKYNGDSQNA